MSRSPNRLLGVIVGGLYAVAGALGFIVTPGVDVIAPHGGLLLGLLEVNPLHNVVHIVIGIGLVIGGISRVRTAALVNSIAGAIFLVLGLAGLFLVGSASNVLAINVADNVLHFATAALLLAAGLGADSRPSE